MSDHTKRFTGKAASYAKYRPDYPSELVPLLRKMTGLKPDHVIADVGSGTGILSRMLLEAGNRVLGVEPNHDMRVAAESFFAGQSKFVSIAATAEATTLPDRSIDLITAGQAFHWFDSKRAVVEFRRILKPEGHVALIWNNDREGTPFWAEFDDFLLEYGLDYKELKKRADGLKARILEFFDGSYTLTKLGNHQDLDLEGFIGRFTSISHAPPPDHPRHSAAIAALGRLFSRHETLGKVRMEYDTEVYIGRPGPGAG